jgi:hypothetical protein
MLQRVTSGIDTPAFRGEIGFVSAALTECKPRQGKIRNNPTVIKHTMKLSKQYQQYESEITKFIRELKEKNPELELKQRAGRALLWDKAPIDLDATKRAKESGVQQQPYVYQTKF